jgi:hypothetical protein
MFKREAPVEPWTNSDCAFDQFRHIKRMGRELDVSRRVSFA